MEGTTLEKLRVVFEAQYAGYKKDMEQVKNATRQVEKVVEAEKAKINKQFDMVSTGKARREIEKLQIQLAKQKEAVSVQEAVIQKINNQYQDLMEGVTKDKAASSLERQLAAAQKELAKLEAQLSPLKEKLELAGRGMRFPELELDTARAQIDEMLPRYEMLEEHIEKLKQQLAEVKMNPESTTTAMQLQQELVLAQEKLERLRETAAGTEQQLERTMNPGIRSSLKEKINGVINKFRQLGSSSKSSIREMQIGSLNAAAGIERLHKRLAGMVGSVFVFSIINKGLTSSKDAMAQYLKKNEQFNNSLTATKTNLQTAFMPIYNKILPGINALMARLEALSQYLAVFMSTVFGTTYKASRKAAEGIETAADAVNDYNSASLGLASFDKLNNLTDSSGSAGGSGGNSVVGDVVNSDAVAAANKFKELLEKMAADTEVFRKALKRLWDEGLSKLKEFTWQGLKDFWNNFLKPMGKWAFGTDGKGLTRLVDILNDDLNGVPWEEINQNLSDFWSAIEPYAEEFGEGLIDFLEDCGDVSTDILVKLFGDSGLMPKVTDWLNKHDPETARKWGYSLGVLITAIAGFSVASNIVTAISRANELLSVLGGLKGLGKIAICVAVAYEGFEIGKEIGKLISPDDTELYDSFKWLGEGGFFDVVSQDWETSLDALGKMLEAGFRPIPPLEAAINDCKDSFRDLKDNFGEVKGLITEDWNGLWEDAKTKFQEWKEDNSQKLQEKKEEFRNKIAEIKQSVSEFGSNVKQQIPLAVRTAFKNAANAAVEIFNKLIDHVNEKMHFEWDPISIAGKEIVPGGSVQLFTIPKIPALAKGGIVTSRTLLEAGEAGKEAVLPLENNTGWMQDLSNMIVRAFREMTNGYSGTKSGNVNVFLQGDTSKFFKAMREEDRKFYRRTGRSAFDYS